MSKTKKCNHKTTGYEWGRDAKGAEVAIAHWCVGCGERLGLGPSNDEPEAVRVEMWIAADIASGGGLLPDEDPVVYADIASGDYFFAIDDQDDSFAWDISRPIAEQLAETARDDAAADFIATQLAIDQSSADAMEYEVTRSAEPDCRDDDDVTHDLGAKDPDEDSMRDPAITAHNAEVIRRRSLPPSPEVCSCHGAALGFETCADYEKWRDFDPFATTVPGDFNGPHGDIP